MSLRTQAGKGSTVTASHAVSFLLVTCGGTHLAIPAGTIRGIVKPDDIGMTEALAILDVRAPVMDLTRRFGLVSSHSANARIIVCGMREVCRAFLVSGVVGLEDLELPKITPLPPHFSGPERRWFSGLFLFRQTVAVVVEPDWLLHDDRESGGQKDGAMVPRRNQKISEGLIQSDAARHNTADARFDVPELEEATDADDIPWAQL